MHIATGADPKLHSMSMPGGVRMLLQVTGCSSSFDEISMVPPKLTAKDAAPDEKQIGSCIGPMYKVRCFHRYKREGGSDECADGTIKVFILLFLA